MIALDDIRASDLSLRRSFFCLCRDHEFHPATLLLPLYQPQLKMFWWSETVVYNFSDLSFEK